MIKVVLFGACGRMGRLAAAQIASADGLKLVAGVEKPNYPGIGGTVENAPILPDTADLPPADIWFDFSLAQPALRHLQNAAAAGTPFIMAATGFTDDGFKLIKDCAETCPVLLAPNLAIGVAALEEAARRLAAILGKEYNLAIIERHHSTKMDTPSGTARRLMNLLKEHQTEGRIYSTRQGGLVGEHALYFTGLDDEVVLTHRAFSRQAFARGVVPAIKFIIGKTPGVYTIADLFHDN